MLVANKRQPKAHWAAQPETDKPIIMGKSMLGQRAVISKGKAPTPETRLRVFNARINDSKSFLSSSN